MLKFDKKYQITECMFPIAQIFKNDNKYGYVYYEDIEYDDEMSDEEEKKEDRNNPFQCEYCNRIFSCKAAKNTHQNRGSCKVKHIDDYIKYAYKGKNVNDDIVVTKDNIKLSGEYKFRPLANEKRRENILIMGPQYSGKSFFAAMYARSFIKVKKNHDVILISRVEDDQKLNSIPNLIRIRINEDLLEDPIDLKQEMKKSLSIFDDITDSRFGKKVNDYVFKLNTEALVNGRDQGEKDNDIYTVTTMHITEGQKTRSILNELTALVLFLPLDYQGERILKTYCGLSERQIKKISKIKSRWVAIYKQRPRFIMTERNVYLFEKF